MREYEKLGAFYLGRPLDDPSGEPLSEPFLYDSKDLTTHAVCVGMTGAGKTGLGVTLIEEAAIDGVPVIAIDPKGDLGNLLLAFPKLAAADFRPWIDENDAARKGRTPQEHAKAMASLWRDGLAQWDQRPERIARYVAAAEPTIFTPGSESGRPLTVLKSFAAPNQALLDDAEALRERVSATVSGLLALLGITADPIQSREHILLSQLFERAWRQKQDLDLPTLIRQIQNPPLTRIGVMDLDTFYPASDRFALATSLNALVASPGFAAWSIGDPLDIGRLLYTDSGKPRLSVISIAHLSETERMFIVTSLLNELVSWMRTQPGTNTLRAILYMDEVFGYLPPSANPPSKIPMLTLLKQARAYGLGIVLSTQNPVDLDYKALSNAGTWFLGRLQTERDKARVLDGLEGAAVSAGEFDRAGIEQTLAGLRSRVFLMNNVHEDAPTVFHTRWALSYLAGPLTRSQIHKLTPAKPPTPAIKKKGAPKSAFPQKAAAAQTDRSTTRPVLPADIVEKFAPPSRAADKGETLIYRPALRAAATLHFVKSTRAVDLWRQIALRTTLKSRSTNPWQEMEVTGAALADLSMHPIPGLDFANLPAAASKAKSYAGWAKSLKNTLYRTSEVFVWYCKKPKLIGLPDEPEGEFRGRLRDTLHEQRDLGMEKVRQRYAPKLARLKDQITRAEHSADKQREQYSHQRGQALISIGATVVGALFGRKLLGKATTAARGFSRASRERADIARAEQKVEDLEVRLQEMERELADDLTELRNIDIGQLDIEKTVIRPRKTDLSIDQLLLVWEPWAIDANGIAEPLS